MSQYYSDFSSEPTGTSVFPSSGGDWSFGINNTSSNNYWDVLDSATATGGKLISENQGNYDTAFLWDQITDNDVELLARVRTDSTGTGVFRLLLRFTGTSQQDYTAYTLTYDDYFYHRIALAQVINGSGTSLNTADFSQTAGNWNWIRFRVNGSTLSAKIWDDADPEPASWMIQENDTGISSGSVGIYSMGEVEQYDLVNVGTAGDSAPDTAAPSAEPPAAPTNLTLTEQ
jgi:hypothetical protein